EFGERRFCFSGNARRAEHECSCRDPLIHLSSSRFLRATLAAGDLPAHVSHRLLDDQSRVDRMALPNADSAPRGGLGVGLGSSPMAAVQRSMLTCINTWISCNRRVSHLNTAIIVPV